MTPKQINAEIEALNRKNYTMSQAKKTWANPFLVPSDNKLLATLVAVTAAPQDTKKDMFAQIRTPGEQTLFENNLGIPKKDKSASQSTVQGDGADWSYESTRPKRKTPARPAPAPAPAGGAPAAASASYASTMGTPARSRKQGRSEDSPAQTPAVSRTP